MPDPSKIAVIVESLYIPEEIKTYQDRFGAAGYEVELAARVPQGPITIYSDNVSDIPFEGEKPLERLTVTVDVDTVRSRLPEYAAVLVAANYTSVRSRYFSAEDGGPRDAPAVKLMAAAMREPRLVKGALCHGLWLLTPCPELLDGRRVTCHEVVRADIANAGALIVASQKVVVDGDLVTGYSKHEAGELVDRILDVIHARRVAARKGNDRDATADRIADALAVRLAQLPSTIGLRPVAQAAASLLDGTLDVAAEVARFTGTHVDLARATSHQPILLLASKFGTWASELTVVAATLRKAGYRVKVATEDGSAPHLLGPSVDPAFQDGAWRCPVVSPAERDLALRFLDPTTKEHELLQAGNIVDLRKLARPPQVGDYVADHSLLDRYRQELKATMALAAEYDGIVIAGGSGAIPGFMADRGLHNLVLAFHDSGKPVMAECNGGLAVAQTIDPRTGRSILRGRAVTTHSWLDEYQRNWGWTQAFDRSTDAFWKNRSFDLAAYRDAESWFSPGLEGNPLIDSEALFRNAVGEQGVFFSPPGSPYAVVVDGTLITCRTTPDGYPGVLALIAVLDGVPPLRGRLFIDRDAPGRTHP